MQKLILAVLLLLPLAVQADEPQCKHEQPRNLQLDLAGVKTVTFDIGANDVDVRASTGASNRIEGRACASDEKYLAQLTLTQRKEGDKLFVTAKRENNLGGISFGNHYAYMKLRASVPDDLMVQLKVGSGDASIDGARAASADVGSGDIKVTHIRGAFTADVGSGDLIAEDVGSIHVLSVSSGDATIKRVRGAAKIGDIGSGDLGISDTQGPVEVGSVGSGDVSLSDIGGDVTVGSIGSGDVEARDVRGNLTVRSVGSGDVHHDGVSGRVDVPKDD